jgi:hypothetical protein
VLLGAVFGLVGAEILYFLLRPDGLMQFGLFIDGHTILGAARGWLAGDGFYPAHQIAGPYEQGAHDILYPPQLLVLLVPFAFLPVIVWVAVPLAILAYIVWWWRPTYWGWVGIGLCLLVPTTFGAFLFANPSMWFVAFVALATRWPAFGPLVLLKPTLAPFGLVGIRHRSWWLSAALLTLLTIAMLPMVVDWVTIMRNNTNSVSSTWMYSLPVVPLMLIPLIARWRKTSAKAPQADPITSPMPSFVS